MEHEGLKKIWVQEILDLAEKSWDVEVLHIALKGSRLYGISTPASDVDLRVVFKTPTQHLLGLKQNPHKYEQISFVDGQKLDIVGHEVKPIFQQLLKHNGNTIESLLAPDYAVWYNPWGEAIRDIAPKFLTKKLHSYYSGYAFNQLKRASAQVKTGKGLLYTYREIYCGIVLLSEGSIIYNFDELVSKMSEHHGFSSAVLPQISKDREVRQELIEPAKQEFHILNDMLDTLAASSDVLPRSYDGTQKLDNLLVRMRSKGWI